jgi:hypothetical protein
MKTVIGSKRSVHQWIVGAALAVLASWIGAPGAWAANLGKVVSIELITANDGNPYIKVVHSGSLVQDAAYTAIMHYSSRGWQDPVYIALGTDSDAVRAAWTNLKEAKDCQCKYLIPLAGDNDYRIISGETIRLDSYGVVAAGNLGNILSVTPGTGRDGKSYIFIDHEYTTLQEIASSLVPNAGPLHLGPVSIPKPADEMTYILTMSMLQKAQACRCIDLKVLDGQVDMQILPQQPNPNSTTHELIDTPTIRLDSYRLDARW